MHVAILNAPAERSFATVPTGTYPATILSVKVLDFTSQPDPFGKTGHHAFEIRHQLNDQVDEDDQPIEILHTIKFQIGDWIVKQGSRAGHIPWLTEYTRALGLPDIQPKQTFDTDSLNGKRSMLSLLEDQKEDGSARNKIIGIGPAAGRARRAAPAPVVAVVPGMDDMDGDVPF
jgi:hypothetical protein